MSSVDLVVVGAGHAGCEAALAAARLGAQVVVVTLRRDTVAQMPCNPALGGVGKGHLMAELDALGGVQAWAADRAGLQFKVLNASRGPAVWGPRAQCDKARYSRLLLGLLEGVDGIELLEGEVVGLLTGDGAVEGVRLGDGRTVRGRRTLLTTGTFLGGVLHTGDERRAGGRFGEAPARGLSRELERLGVKLQRYKTGTPPRLAAASLDHDRLVEQPGDLEPRAFSWRTRRVRNRIVCWVTRTPARVQEIIRENLHRSPLYSGRIEGVGPRYCPSIEDKVVRFPHHREHTLFLEPEGLGSPSVYVNGLSTSLPRDVQEAIVHAVPGLEGAELLRYGYAVEYDVVAPGQVEHALGVRALPGLLAAGQLLGTSGYEEAAALGFVAGVNAALSVRGEDPFIPGREEAYLGVLVDDVVMQKHEEPYRMLTSRAEHRLLLGVDSARERLMPAGRRLGLVPEAVFHVEQRRWEARRTARERLENERLNPDAATREMVRGLVGIDLSAPASWAQVLRRPEVALEAAETGIPALEGLAREDRRAVVSALRYTGYLARHQREAERLARLRSLRLPRDFDPGAVRGLSLEAREALRRHRPATLADAERLPGITPAAAAILAGHLGAGHGGDA